jgi:hypothetical protein
MRRGIIVSIVGLIILILGLAIGPIMGPKTNSLMGPVLGLGIPIIGLVVLGFGLWQMFVKSKPAPKKEVFIKCPYCRATIPIDSEKCPVCSADLKK